MSEKASNMVHIKTGFFNGMGLLPRYVMSLLLFLVHTAVIASQAHLPGQVIQPVRQYSGTPYFIDEWVKGDVMLNTGETATDVYLRYDGQRDRLLWLIPEEGNKQVQIDKYLVHSFVLKSAAGNHIFRRAEVPMLGGSSGVGVFAEVITQGCIALLVYRRVRVSDRFGQFIDENNQVRQALMLIDDPLYYISFPDGPASPVRPNRRSFMGVAGNMLSPEQMESLHGIPAVLRSENQLREAVERMNQVQPEIDGCE